MHQLHIILFLIAIFGIETISCKSKYAFSLLDSSQRVTHSSGRISSVTVNELPILKRLSMRHVTIASSSIREPHWHPNANELGYCLSGSALITIYGNNDEHETFIITSGEMYFVPSGYLHHIENLDNSNSSSSAEFIVAFTHELPEDFGLSSTYSAMTNAVLGNTFGLVSSAFEGIEHHQAATVFGRKNTSENSDIHREYTYPNKYKFDAEGLSAKISKAEGLVKTVTNKYWPVLEDISMYSLRITNVGMREPHWHPRTAEMGYVLQGHARMTIVSPDHEQKFETYTLKPGDMYFIPRAYPHHIENIGDESIRFLIFFDQPVPGDVGFTGVFSAYSRQVLAATLQCQPNELPQFAFHPKNLLIVERVNPVDP